MQRHVFSALVTSALGIASAHADPLSLQPDRYGQTSTSPARRPTSRRRSRRQPSRAACRAAPRSPPVRYAAADPELNLGGGFIEFLFSGGPRARRRARPPT